MFLNPASFTGQTTLLQGLPILAMILLLTYVWQRRNVAAQAYSPKLAWLRAGLYFCACLFIATASGVLAHILTTPLVSAQQWADPLWWMLTLACLAVIVIAYAVIWPIGTFSDGRKHHRVVSLLYGGVWGACQGLLFLTFWAWAERGGLAVHWVAVIAYVAIGAYNGVWHHFFWDIYVSPPHNYSEWNSKKVLFCHTPNLLVCLSYLALYGNAGIYVLLQSVALAASASAMRFPAFWDDYTAVPGQERPIAEKQPV